MSARPESSASVTIGLDLGDRYSHLCVVDPTGEIIEEGRLTTTKTSFIRRFEHMSPVRVVIEASVHSPWVSRLLHEQGHEVIVANPRKMRLIYQNNSKSDKVDAQYLARIGRMDPQLLSPIQHRGEETMTARAIVRSRELLVRTRTRMISHIRGLVKTAGARVPSAWSPHFAVKARDYLPAALKGSLEPILDQIETITNLIRSYDQQIEKLAKDKYPETAVLTQIHGVGTLTALWFVLTIEDPRRFNRSRDVGSYIGLRPRQFDSGERQPQLRITKAGDGVLRKYLVQCAQSILGPKGADSDLRRWGLTLAERGGKAAKKRAVIAVARKLAVLMHRLLLTGEVYQPTGYGRQSPSNMPA